MAKRNKIELVFLILLIFILFFLLLLYFSKGKNGLFDSILTSIESDKRSKNLPTPTQTPTPRPIPHGKIGFTIGQSDKTVPQFRNGSIDPYDPANGATQTVTIAVKHSQPVTNVTVVLKTDHATSQPYPLKLINGSDTDGEWQGSWKVEDSYFYTYKLILKATSSDSFALTTVTLR